MPQCCEKKSLCMKQVSQYVTLQTVCILHHTYTLQVREEYSFLMGKDSILVLEVGLELSVATRCHTRWPAGVSGAKGL